MVLKRKLDYEEASEENAWRLLAEVSLSKVRLQEVTELIFEAISLKIEEDKTIAPIVEDESSEAGSRSHEDGETLKGCQPAMVEV